MMLQRSLSLLVAVPMVFLSACSNDSSTPAAEGGPAAGSPLAEAWAAHGMEGLHTLTVGGTAWRVRNSFRQTHSASPPWPERDEISNYQRTLDLDAVLSRATGDTFASSMFLDPPVAGTFAQNVTPAQPAWTAQLDFWLTPWGFLKGAEVNGATAGTATVDGVELATLSWQTPATQVSPAGLQYTVTGYLNEQHLLTRVETRVEDDFMGDLLVANVYDGYHEVSGLQLPSTVEQQRGGGGVFGALLSTATVNPANAGELLTVPPPAAAAPPPPPAAAPAELSEQVAPGVYAINGGYVSLAIEFADYIAVFEAGQSRQRGEQILAEVKRLFPTKPIRYLINTHPHSDHTAGMVPFVREGATIVTEASNVDFLRMALSTPRTLLGEETLAPTFEAASGVYVIEDATRRLELHHLPNLHSEGTLFGLLPRDRLLFQADFTLPVSGAKANPFVVDLANYVVANGLDFDRYLAVHAAAVVQTKADLLAAIGQ